VKNRKNNSLKGYTKAVFVSFCAVALVAAPFVAQADIVSFISGALGDSPATDTATVTPQNTQNLALLEAPINSNPQPTKSDEDTSIVNDSVLTSEDSGVNGDASSTDTTQIDSESSDQISLYTVHAGDSLGEIAQMYNVSVNTIIWANDLKKGQAISPGDVLVILPISGIKYTVKKGDTVNSVAKSFNADVSDIVAYNGVDEDQGLTIGQQIIIPDGEISQGTGDAAPTTTTTKSGSKTTTTKSSSTGKTTTSKGRVFQSAAGGSMTDPNGYFIRPIVGGVRTQGIHGNNAVDLASSYGTPILAAAAGKVILVKTGGWDGGYGNYAVIQHPNGMQTLYAHMSTVVATQGQSVTQGEVIGHMGETGDATGVHVHFEVRGGVNPF
jgi:LysM repeat protein